METSPVPSGNNSKQPKTQLKISPKQERFAKEYVIDHNATRSAIAAGYSERSAQKHAHRMVANGGVATRIAELEKATADELGITHRFVLGGVKDSAKDNKTKNPSVSLKAFELMGQHIGTFGGDQGKTKDDPQWTGVEIDFGDGILKVVTGTGPLDNPQKN